MNYHLLYQWEDEIASRLSCLNSWQVANLALFSYGVIQAESSQQQTLARHANGHEQVESTKRRWRRFLDNGAFPLAAFFQQWVCWIVQTLGSKRLVLLVDETKISDRMGVMVLGLAWEGRCIPLVWRCYAANDKLAYPAEGQVGLIAQLCTWIHAVLPPDTQVVVLADRGIGTSPKLCQALAALGWFYLFRVTAQSKILTETGEYTIAQQVQAGELWRAEGQIFKKRGRIPAAALALWSEGYDEPWALVTNDPAAQPLDYAQRNWQEQSFRDLKSGGWHWGASRIRQADHMERLLVVLTLAYAWMLALGSQAVCLEQAQPLHQAPSQAPAGGHQAPVRRQWSLFKEGLRFFTQYLHRFGVYLGLIFIPDKRFT